MEVSTPSDPDRLSGAAAVLMTLTMLWSGALAVGFAWSAADGGPRMSGGRALAFWLIAGFLALLAARTGYELVRRLVPARRR